MEPLFNPHDSPDVFGVGAVSCPCGEMRLRIADAHRAIALRVSCPFCGGIAEVTGDAE